MNEGLGLARGKYICFLASDDTYEPTRVENAVYCIESASSDVAAVYCDGYLVNHDGNKIGLFSQKHPRPLFGSTYENLLFRNWIPALGVTYRTDILKDFTFDERFQVEDYTLFLRLFKKDKYKLLLYSDFGFSYRWHSSNFSGNAEVMAREFALMESYFEDVRQYSEFKRKIRSLGKPGFWCFSWKNFRLLMLQGIAEFQSFIRRPEHKTIKKLNRIR